MPIHLRPKSEYATRVLLPGDPDRARYLAQTYLEEAQELTSYRQLLGYTGRFQGMPLSIQATGMGAPSAAIVLQELLDCGVNTFVRLGSCGALDPSLAHGDLLLVTGACPMNGASRVLAGIEAYAPVADFGLNMHFALAAEALELSLHPALVGTMDLFYDPRLKAEQERYKRLQIRALEMEASMVFTAAALGGGRGACLLTVSDIIESQHRASPERIRKGVDDMLELALAGLLRDFHALGGES